MASTILLDTIAWDLVVDVNGNIAVATEPYAHAQDAASALKLFQGELWWDISQGVPYWAQILEKTPPLSLVKAYMNKAALSVPGVTRARTFLNGITTRRQLTGQVQILDENSSVIAAVGF